MPKGRRLAPPPPCPGCGGPLIRFGAVGLYLACDVADDERDHVAECAAVWLLDRGQLVSPNAEPTVKVVTLDGDVEDLGVNELEYNARVAAPAAEMLVLAGQPNQGRLL